MALATQGHVATHRFSDGSQLGIDNELFGATSIGYSADGAMFAASTSQGLKVWRVSDGALLSSIPALANADAVGADANTLGVSNDGSVVAIRKGNQVVISRPAGVGTIAGDIYAFGGVSVSPDGTLVAAKYWKATGSKTLPHGYYDGAWRVSDGQLAWTTTLIGAGLSEVPGHVIFSLDGTLIAFGYGSQFDGPRLLHASDGSLVRTLATEPVAFSADGLALLGYPLTGGSLQIIRLSDGVVARTITIPTTNSKPLAARFSTGTTTVSVIDPGGTGALQLFTDGTQTGSVARLGWQYTVAGVAIPPDDYFPGNGVLSPDGTREALTGNNAVSVMQVKSGGVRLSVPVLLFTITLPASTNAVAFSPDGTLIATGDTNDTAALWSASDGSLVYQHTWDLSGPTGNVSAVAFSPDGARVVTAGSDATVNFWDVATGANLKTISTAPGALGSVSFSPDGTQLIGSYLPASSITRIWDVNSGLVVGSLPGSTNPVLDGSRSLLFIGNPGGGIESYSYPALADLGTLPLTQAAGGALAIAGSGSMLVSSGYPTRFWCLSP